MSKKVYSIISIIISIILIFSLQSEVYASSAKMSVSSTKVETGKTVDITVNINSAATWDLDISTTGGTLKKSNDRVGNTDSGNNENKTVTLGTFTAETAGSYKITLSGYVVDGDTLTKVTVKDEITIVVEKTVQQPTTPEQPTTPTQPQTPATKSSEARLKNLGIRPNDFKGFKKDKYEYSTTVPNSVAEVEVYAEKENSNAKVEGTGKVTLKEGDNTVKVKVTAEDGKTTKTYTLTIKRKTVAEESAENGEARLKTLGIKPEEYDFKGFDSEKTEYSVEVQNEIDEIEVYATAMNSSAQITGTGMIKLKEGKNELKVDVISANGTKKTYTLEVTRKEADGVSGTTEEKFGLSTLSIEGITLKPSFKVGTYEYTAELTKDLASLDIQAKSNDKDATVEIYGNENLQQGENVITIQVTNKETKKMATYQIIVNKNVVEETVQTSWLKPSTWGQEEKIKIAIIIVLIILIICAVILKIKISKDSIKAKEVDLPGAEELDKAIAEHQELSEGPSYTENTEVEDVPKNESKQNYIEDIAKNKFGEMEDETDEKAKRKGRHF